MPTALFLGFCEPWGRWPSSTAECRVFWRQHKPGSRRLVATTHVRGRCRCLRRRRRQRRCDCSLARCGGTRLRLARTGEQHQDENRKCRTKYDYFFHKLNCFFKNNSSQVPSPDVLKQRILLKSRPLLAASLGDPVSASIREFSS